METLIRPHHTFSETHAHADHLTAAQYLKQQLQGGTLVCIGQRIKQVQQAFAPIYGLDSSSLENMFDVHFGDNETFKLGSLSCYVLHLPGHTPDHVGFVIGKAVFTGDSIFNVCCLDLMKPIGVVLTVMIARCRICSCGLPRRGCRGALCGNTPSPSSTVSEAHTSLSVSVHAATARPACGLSPLCWARLSKEPRSDLLLDCSRSTRAEPARQGWHGCRLVHPVAEGA